MDQNQVKAIATSTFALLGWSLVFTYVLFNVFGGLILKTQVMRVGQANFSNFSSIAQFFLSLISSWKTWVALFSISLSTATWTMALAHLELSRAYPVAVGFNLLIVVGMSILHFHEPLTFFKIIGTFLILLGAIFIFR